MSGLLNLTQWESHPLYDSPLSWRTVCHPSEGAERPSGYFAIMGIDKRKAIKGAYRIPEATLFCVALLGGSLGTTLGMNLFRHKTKHWYFVVGMPLIFFAQLALMVWIGIQIL